MAISNIPGGNKTTPKGNPSTKGNIGNGIGIGRKNPSILSQGNNGVNPAIKANNELDNLSKKRHHYAPNGDMIDNSNSFEPNNTLNNSNQFPEKKDGLSKGDSATPTGSEMVDNGAQEVSVSTPAEASMPQGNVAQPNKRNHFNNGLNTNNIANQAINKFNKNNRPKPKKEEPRNAASSAPASAGDKKAPAKGNNVQNAAPKASTGKKNPASTAAKSVANKTPVGKALGAASKMGAAKNMMNNISNQADEAANQAGEMAKSHVKAMAKKKVMAAIMKVLLPILPYVGIALLVAFFFLILLAIILVWFSDEDRYMDTMEVNYCSAVNLKWKEIDPETNEEVEKEADLTSDEYIAYLMSTSEFANLEGEELNNAIAVVYRTNFYATVGNMDSDTCYYEIETPYEGYSEKAKAAVDATDNKIFSRVDNEIFEIPLDTKFSYTREDTFDDGEEVYVLYQDKVKYPKSYVNEHVDADHLSSEIPEFSRLSFPPFAAQYLAEEKLNTWTELLYHYLGPGAAETFVRKVKKKPIGGYGYDWGGGNGGCSDMPLATTSLTREQFIAAVEAKVPNADFKNNAGKIYDVAIANNFNPELIIIRAKLEGGYTEQGGRYNYFGIKCYNGVSKCQSFTSMDQAVLEYIKIVKGYNVPTLFDVMKKYSNLGDYWFNPGGPGLGGCYYYTYLLKYLSPERQKAVTIACTANTTCSKGGIGSCVSTTQEDKDAYTKYQVEKMTNERQNIFGIGPEVCENPTEYSGDGGDIINYARANFTNAIYTQDSNLRMQPGYADCSSLVYRVYAHFGVNVGTTSVAIYNWCVNNKKMVSSSDLKPGDIIIFNHGVWANTSHQNNIGHVSLYVGPGRQFAAHGKKVPTGEGPYNNNGDFFCRPLG